MKPKVMMMVLVGASVVAVACYLTFCGDRSPLAEKRSGLIADAPSSVIKCLSHAIGDDERSGNTAESVARQWLRNVIDRDVLTGLTIAGAAIDVGRVGYFVYSRQDRLLSIQCRDGIDSAEVDFDLTDPAVASMRESTMLRDVDDRLRLERRYEDGLSTGRTVKTYILRYTVQDNWDLVGHIYLGGLIVFVRPSRTLSKDEAVVFTDGVHRLALSFDVVYGNRILPVIRCLSGN